MQSVNFFAVVVQPDSIDRELAAGPSGMLTGRGSSRPLPKTGRYGFPATYLSLVVDRIMGESIVSERGCQPFYVGFQLVSSVIRRFEHHDSDNDTGPSLRLVHCPDPTEIMIPVST